MKAILIARVSTEEQREAGNSLPAQLARLERYCQNKGFQIIKTCSFDESAYGTNRSEFDRIIDFILEQKEKVVVCCDKVDRLTRNIFDKRVSVLYQRAKDDLIELHFVSDGQVINGQISATDKFRFNMSLGLANYYSDAISDNVRRAMEQKLRRGELVTLAPYGYKNIKNSEGNSDVIVDEYEAHVIRQAFELYATGTYSLITLIKKLKDEYRVPWGRANLARLLSNKLYYGIMVINGVEYPHRYPPIITQELYNKVNRIKTKIIEAPAQHTGLAFIYRGLIRCGDCGLAITPEMKKQKYVYYHCTQYKGSHKAKWIREEKITEQLGNVFKNLQMPEEIAIEIQETLNEVHKDKVDFHNREFDKLTKEQKTTTTMLDNLYLDKLKGRITESDYDRFYTSLRDQQSDITARLAGLQEAEDNYYITTKYILDLTNRAYDLFMSSEAEEKRALVSLVLSNLEIKDENLVYTVRKPFDLILKNVDCLGWRG